MNDAQFVKVFDTTDDLLEELAGLCFLQLLLLHDVVKEFASVDELHDQKQLLWRLDDLEELNDVGVPDQLQDVDLPSHSLYVCLASDLTLFKDFDGHLDNRNRINISS